MSASSSVSDVASSPVSADVYPGNDITRQVEPVSDAVPKNNGNYKGFVGGVFSGIAKLSVG